MAVAHRLILAMLLCLAMSMTWSQYSLGLLLISSDAHKNCTFDIFIPAAFHTSIKYLPTVLILSISPPYLLLSMANQSATQNTKMHPASISLFTFIALRIPWAMCILPEGSNPSQHLMNLFFFRRSLSSSSLVHSTPMDLMRLNLYSSESLEGTGSKYWLILKVKLDLASFSLCFQSCYCWRSQNWRPPVVQSMRDCIQSIKELLQGLLRSIYLERILIFCKRIKGKRETIRGLIRYHLHHFSLVFRKQWADRVSVNPTRLLYSVSFSFFSLYFQWSRLLGVRLRAILVTRDLVGVLEPVIPPLSMYPVTFTVGAFFVSDRSLLAVIDTDLFSSSLLFTARFSLSSSFSIRPFIGFLFSSLGNMQLKASSQLILSSYFILRHILMNSLLFSETQESKTMGFPMMLLISWISFLAGQGVCPCNNSQQISPTDHKSDLFVYLALARICGDMYKGVPTIDLITVFSPLSRSFANPKSLILQTPPFKSILAGLRSLCVISWLTRYLNPFRISLSILSASFSVPFFLLLSHPARSPSSQNSVTIYMLLLVWQTSSNFTMLG